MMDNKFLEDLARWGSLYGCLPRSAGAEPTPAGNSELDDRMGRIAEIGRLIPEKYREHIIKFLVELDDFRIKKVAKAKMLKMPERRCTMLRSIYYGYSRLRYVKTEMYWTWRYNQKFNLRKTLKRFKQTWQK